MFSSWIYPFLTFECEHVCSVLFLIFLATPRSMWDLSSLTKDLTVPPALAVQES